MIKSIKESCRREKSHDSVVSSEFPGKPGHIPKLEYMLNAAPPRVIEPSILNLIFI
jgi:hypothetical protein